MRAIILAACVVAMACSDAYEGEPLTGDASISTTSPDAIVGAWSLEQGPCTHSILFGSAGRYEAATRCPDGDDRDEAGAYEARGGVLYASPDDGCTVGDWDAPYVVTGSHLILADLAFSWIDDAGPFGDAISCD